MASIEILSTKATHKYHTTDKHNTFLELRNSKSDSSRPDPH